jgi:hypothetical protein
MKTLNRHTLGIIACHNGNSIPPFSESSFFYHLTLAGRPNNIDVIIFNPKEIDWENRTVLSWYVTPHRKWLKKVCKLPKVIYDRCYYLNSKHYTEYKSAILKIDKDPHIRFLGRALGGKAKTYEILKQHEEMLPFLPETKRYQSESDVVSFLSDHGKIVLKPNGGSHGRGIVAIEKHPNYFEVRERSQLNNPFHYKIKSEIKLRLWIKKFVGETRYIIQPFLELTTQDNRPFDVRILVQKNGNLEWETTGLAVRIGKSNTITSNLHGGGQATTLEPFLDENYPMEMIPDITEQINRISTLTPPLIEENHGPLLELGLDVGIDRKGSLWLLEVNSKPGRTIFLKTGEKEIRQRSIQLPMSYAYTLLKSS